MKEKTQKQLFIEKARELGCDEDEAAFKERLRKIAKAVPEPKKTGNKQETSRPKKKPRQGARLLRKLGGTR
jgi:hypothetical protein